MSPGNHTPQQQPNTSDSTVNIGNASNPAPTPDELQPMSDNQFLPEGAEKYLRESASIEDYPDARDQQDMDETIKRKEEEEG
jgi:hypothetical protein